MDTLVAWSTNLKASRGKTPEDFLLTPLWDNPELISDVFIKNGLTKEYL
jgi:hypothetical protein